MLLKTIISQAAASATKPVPSTTAAPLLQPAPYTAKAPQISGAEIINFYKPITDTRRRLRNWLLFVTLVATLVSFYPSSLSAQLFAQFFCWLIGISIALILWPTVQYVDEISLDLHHGSYVTRSGIPPGLTVRSGPIYEITQIRLPARSGYAAFLEFDGRPPARIDDKRCALRQRLLEYNDDYRSWLSFLVELAAQLNVPLIDESGWRGQEAKAVTSERIVVLPGEAHPYLQPRKWKRW